MAWCVDLVDGAFHYECGFAIPERSSTGRDGLRLRVGAAALPILSALAFGWIAFHCAYRKPGTKFLIFILILSGCGFVSTPIFYFSGHLPAPPYIPYFGTYLLLSQAIGIYWVFLSWKMRKINKRLKGLAVESQA